MDSLDLNDPDSAGTVEAKEHQVRGVLARGAGALHPLCEGGGRGTTEVCEHTRAAEGSGEKGGEGLDDRAVAGGLQPHPVHALHEVERAKGGEGGVGNRRLAGGADEGHDAGGAL